MRSRSRLLKLALALSLSIQFSLSAQDCFKESNSDLVIEAENFTSSSINNDPSNLFWTVQTAVAGASGSYVSASSANWAGSATFASSAELSYNIKISNSGNYNIWIRRYYSGGSDNSVYAGIDGSQTGSTDNGSSNKTWSFFKIGAIDLSSGQHTINLRRREANYCVDMIVLTQKTTTPTQSWPLSIKSPCNEQYFTLTLDIRGQGGSLFADPPGPSYPAGTHVYVGYTLENNGYLSGLGGTGCSEYDCQFVMDRNRTVTAEFGVFGYYTLNITHTGNGSGVTGSQLIDGLGGSNNTYREYDLVKIYAIPDENSEFTGWSGSVSGTEPELEFGISQDMNIQANFRLKSSRSNNQKVSISSQLLTSDNSPANGEADMTVRLFDAAVGGNVKYIETFRNSSSTGISVKNGAFTVILGEGSSDDDFNKVISENTNLWAEFTIESLVPGVLTPRSPLTSSPYSLQTVPKSGEGDPNNIYVPGAIGTYYHNTIDNTTWLKLFSGWKKLD